MRLGTFTVAGSSLLFALAGCSNAPGDVTYPAGTSPDSRKYEYSCSRPTPPETSGGDTWADIYDQLLSAKGVGTCQDGVCHGGSAGQGGVALGTDSVGAWCGFAASGYVTPLVSCKSECPTLCASSDAPSCCSIAPSDAGTDASSSDGGTDAATDAGTAIPGSVAGLVSIISPVGSKPPQMPRPLCGNRALSSKEIARIVAWGRKGAPLD